MFPHFHNVSVHLFPPTTKAWSGTGSDREVAVLMSGGVDSSVTAMLLKDAGWDVLGITMKIPLAEQCGHPRPCCGAEAGLICEELDIAHYFLDVEQAFEQLVIEPFRRSYLEGRTPSPCVDCNTILKFRVVWDFLENTFGMGYIATGHYARVVHAEGRSYLAGAKDKARDQSYFLYGVPRERLDRLMFPLGEWSKQAVREMARERGLPVAEKDDSMELCFAGEADYRRALDEQAAEGGPILDMDANVIARHEGISNYTLGQRRGLGVAAGKALYVTRISPQENAVTVGTREEASRCDVWADELNVLIPDELRPNALLHGKIRSYGGPSPCEIVEVGSESMLVEFEAPQFAPSPGQRLVLYDGQDRVVAGGTIFVPHERR